MYIEITSIRSIILLRTLDLNCRNNGTGTLNLHLEFILE